MRARLSYSCFWLLFIKIGITIVFGFHLSQKAIPVQSYE